MVEPRLIGAEPRLIGRSRAPQAEPGSAGGARLCFGLLPVIWAPATWPDSDLFTAPQKHTFNWPVGMVREVNKSGTAVTTLGTRLRTGSARFTVGLRPDVRCDETRLRQMSRGSAAAEPGGISSHWVSCLGGSAGGW